MRLWLAIRTMFRVLFDSEAAAGAQKLLKTKISADPSPPAKAAAGKKPTPPTPNATAKPTPPPRSDAITLLATLQREARLVDIVQEPLGDYSDEQVGAAARDVLRDCGQVLERLFALQPISEETEGAEVQAPDGFDPGRYRLTGNVNGDPPFRGSLVHHGWTATRCQVPEWSGSADSALVIAPLELEIS